MSIRFGWTRSQEEPSSTDDEKVPDGSSPARPGAPTSPDALDALRDATSAAWATSATAANTNSDAAAEIVELHERVLDAERRANRVFSRGNARREHHDALVAEADALNKLGYQTYDQFAAATNAPATPAAPPRPAAPSVPTSSASEAVDRIRVLLGHLGVEPGDDPLNTAKQFLSNVEDEDLPTEAIADAVANASAPEAARRGRGCERVRARGRVRGSFYAHGGDGPRGERTG